VKSHQLKQKYGTPYWIIHAAGPSHVAKVAARNAATVAVDTAHLTLSTGPAQGLEFAV
jgi:hypothetical protein